MSIYAISDLHLPLGVDKPMEIFGSYWENYTERIYENWRKTVKEGDCVLIPGDVSWATYLEHTIKDFEFIHSLPGKKIISRGNHDYWWTTAAKLEKFRQEEGLSDFVFLHNNATYEEGYAICVARGWKSPFDKGFTPDDKKIYERELIRLRLSLEEGKKLSDKIIVMMHYPPDVGFNDLIEEYGVKKCVYCHLHGAFAWEKQLPLDNYFLVSADYLQFEPKLIIK